MSDWYLYIIENRLGQWYTGISTDPMRRLQEHEKGNKGAKALRGKGPLKLVVAVPVGDRAAASRAEACLKRLSRAHKQRWVQGQLRLPMLASPETQD